MKSAKNIEKLIRKINVTPGAKMDQKTLDDILMAQGKTKKKFSADIQPNTWRIIMKSKITKFAAAAMIIIAVLIGINQFGGSSSFTSVAWADVVERFRSVPFFKATIYMKEDVLDRPVQITMLCSSLPQ